MKGEFDFVWLSGRWVPSTSDVNGASTLAAWIFTDIQERSGAIDSILSDIARVHRGDRPIAAPDTYVDPNPFHLGVGNAFDCYSNGELFFLEELDLDESVLLEVNQLKDALTQYKRLLQNGLRDPSNRPTPVAVEWIAHRREARAMAEAAGLLVRRP